MVKIVITGGTFAGKSTLVKELSIQGFKVFFDQGFVVIDELNSKIGLEKQKLFRNDKPQLFYQKIIDKQVEITCVKKLEIDIQLLVVKLLM